MKLPLLFLALTLSFASVYSQTANEAALKAVLAEKQLLDTPKERERIKQTCLAETQAWLDKNYEAWAATHYQSELDNMNWNNPDGSYGGLTGWANIEPALKGVMKTEPKDAGKLSHENYAFLIRGNMAYVYFDQVVVQADGKTDKAKEHRILLYDGRDGNWKLVGMNAFWDHKGTK